MEFRDKLLSSEIRHITDLINVLSYELVIIQDFMEQQFGKTFKRFRERHLLSAEVVHEGTRRIPSSANKVNSFADGMDVEEDGACSETAACDEVRPIQRAMRNVEHSASQLLTGPVSKDISSDTLPEMSDGNDRLKLSTVNDPLGSADTHNIPLSSQTKQRGSEHDVEDGSGDSDDDFNDSNFEHDSDDDNSDEDKSWSNKIRVGGRKTIWSKFDCKKLPGGKKMVTCKNCNQQVSAVAKRLERHYQHCVLGNKNYKITVTAATRVSSSGEVIKGKPLSLVWTYCNKTINQHGLTIVTCKFCDKKLSNHATRITKHLQNCSKSPAFETLSLS